MHSLPAGTQIGCEAIRAGLRCATISFYVDQDWVALAKELELDEKFLQDNEQHIVRFIMGEGAEMTRLYYEYTENKEAFRRIILAD